jgi:subtilisin family serine protease
LKNRARRSTRSARSRSRLAAFACAAALASPAAAQQPRIASDVFESLQKSPLVLVTVALPASAHSAMLEARIDYASPASVRSFVESSAERFAAAKSRLQLDKRGLRLVRDYKYLPVVLAEVVDRAEALASLEKDAGIRSVTPNLPHAAFTGESLKLIRQAPAAASGATGKDVAVAVLDTGVDVKDPEFGCTAPGPGCPVVLARRIAPLVPGGARPSRHGTNVAAIIHATAPQAKLIDLAVFRGNRTFPADVMEGINWVVGNRAQYNIVAMNLSLGGGKFTAACGERAYAAALEHAARAGVVGVAASGNNAWKDATAEPACAPAAISVGAVYDAKSSARQWQHCKDDAAIPDSIACFTNRAPFLGILAPGADVKAGGAELGGTSQAAPFVAGAVAALWSLYRGETPEHIRQVVLESGARVKDSGGREIPRVDLAGALELAKQRNFRLQ